MRRLEEQLKRLTWILSRGDSIPARWAAPPSEPLPAACEAGSVDIATLHRATALHDFAAAMAKPRRSRLARDARQAAAGMGELLSAPAAADPGARSLRSAPSASSSSRRSGPQVAQESPYVNMAKATGMRQMPMLRECSVHRPYVEVVLVAGDGDGGESDLAGMPPSALRRRGGVAPGDARRAAKEASRRRATVRSACDPLLGLLLPVSTPRRERCPARAGSPPQMVRAVGKLEDALHELLKKGVDEVPETPNYAMAGAASLVSRDAGTGEVPRVVDGRGVGATCGQQGSPATSTTARAPRRPRTPSRRKARRGRRSTSSSCRSTACPPGTPSCSAAQEMQREALDELEAKA